MILFGSKARGDFHEKSDTDIVYKSAQNIFTEDINGNFDIIHFEIVDNKYKEKIEIEGFRL